MRGVEAVRALGVVLTSGCNLRCSYCYQNAKRPRTIEGEVLRASLDLLLRSRQPRIELAFLGGEPLLAFPLMREATGYAESVRPPGLALRYSIVTNGTLLRGEVAAFLSRHRFRTQLSFDGVRAAQDFRGKGTFAVLDALLDQLRAGFPRFFREDLDVNLTAHSATIPQLADSVAYLVDKGLREIHVTPVSTHDSGWRAESIEGLERQFDRVLRLCLRHYQRTGEVPLGLFRKGRHEEEQRLRWRAMCCAPAGRSLTVDVDGQVYGCALFVGSYQSFPSGLLRSALEPLRLGDLRDPRFPARLALYPRVARRAGLFHRKRQKHSCYGRCRDCRYFSLCGVCPVSIGHIPGNMDPDRIPDFLCAWNRVALEHRERFLRQAGRRGATVAPRRHGTSAPTSDGR